MGKRIWLTIFLSFFLLFFSSFAYAQMAVFVFGDSQVDVGNNNFLPLSMAKADFPHYGIDFPTKKPTGRFSNGKNAADFISEKLGVPSSPAFLSMAANAPCEDGVNFASAGAGILNSTGEKFNQAMSLTLQITHFIEVKGTITKKLGNPEGLELLSKSVFVIIAGSNDLFDCFKTHKPETLNSPQQYVDSMLGTLKDQVKRLHTSGARKFLVTGLAVLGCIPQQRVQFETEECNKNLNTWALKYNEGLVLLLKGLKSELPTMSYTYFNSYSLMDKIIQNPSAYEFVETKAACCGLGKLRAQIPCVPIAHYCPNRRNHMFWDLYHPSEATARIFVDAIYNGSSEFTFPLSLKELVAAS